MTNRYILILFLLHAVCCETATAQAPLLGAASAYVLFSSGGAVGNTGAGSHFTGNIGTSGGAVTIGVNVNGVLHNADADAIAANAAVLLLYDQIQAIAPTDTQVAVGSYSLGNKDTIFAGVDSINVSTILTDTLVLDAQNNPNALFIFKINGSFTSDNSLSPPAIVLINGALACNVFFHVNGAIDMSGGTSLKGTFISNSAAINLDAGTTLEGRALSSTAGAITTTNALAYLPTGCGSPVLTGPAAPVLGAIACYALFTGVGSNTNAGITNVAGDVGSDLGLTTGYNALLVNGSIHSNPDLSTTAAAASLATLSAYLNNLGLVPDIELLFPAQFGNNLVLTPHIYLLSAATPLTGTVFLNAEGNPNAVFVIKILGAMSTSVGARVELVNGTQASNVYWIINGALSIASNADMKGSFIVETGAVDIGTGAVLDGRALTTNGAFTADAISASIPPLSCPVPLPVSWLYFRGARIPRGVALQWATTHGARRNDFLVERSADGNAFVQIAAVHSTITANASEERYEFIDSHPLPLGYYRIAHGEPEGKLLYSSTVGINSGTAALIPNTAYVQGSSIMLNFTSDVAGDGRITVYGMDGRKVSSSAIVLTAGAGVYSLQRPLGSGVFLLYVETVSGRHQAGKVSCY